MAQIKVRETESYVVIDNFLDTEDHLRTYRYHKNLEFKFVHTEKKVKAFRILDGDPLWSDPVLSHSYEKNTLYPTYPLGNDLDILINKISEFAHNNETIIGKRGKEWAYFFIRAYLYPLHTGLSWHTDGKFGAAGAFVYYAHPNWNPNWGGELLISDLSTSSYCKDEPTPSSCWSNSHHNDAIMNEGVGDYILPKPNRLVLMKGGMFHTIKKVDPAAGDNMRMTLQGFFHDPAKTLV